VAVVAVAREILISICIDVQERETREKNNPKSKNQPSRTAHNFNKTTLGPTLGRMLQIHAHAPTDT